MVVKKATFLHYIFCGLVGGVVGGLTVGWVIGVLGSGGITNVINTQQNITLQEDSAVIEAVARVAPSVVSIVSNRDVMTVFGGIFEEKGSGTGFIIRDNGLIATNRHVVADDKASYTVITSDGITYDAEVIAKDPFNDLAIIKIKTKDLPVADLGDSDALRVGQRVMAIGNALGEYQNTVTVGVVSAIGRVIVASSDSGYSERLEGMIQTDAAINLGNSGGPLVNMAGQVIGINTAIALQGSQIGFAISINSVKSAIESVLATGTIRRPMLGIRYIHITKEFAALNNLSVDRGALIVRGDRFGELAVTRGGPADQAGIEENDIIVSINDQEIGNNNSIITILCRYQPGDVVKIKLLRAGRQLEVSVKLGELKL